MTRRRLVALVSAAVLVTLGLLVFAGVLFLTHTSTGRDKLRDLARPYIAKAQAKTADVWWVQGFVPDEDVAI